MELAGTVALAAQAGRAVGRIGFDAVAERAGRALPRTREQIAEFAAVRSLVDEHAGAAADELAGLAEVDLAGVDFESSNCENFLLDLRYDGALGPATAYVKMPCAEMSTRVFARALGFWELEVRFCQNLDDDFPIRVPKVYAAAHRGTRFVLLLEDINALAGATLFDNAAMAAGTTIERAESVLRMFARLHRAFHDLDARRRESLLPASLSLQADAAPRRAAMSRALNARAIDGCLEKAPPGFDAALAEVCRRATGDRAEALHRAWYGGPLTLIHGDSHLGNVFEFGGDDGPEMGMLDFQAVQWSRGIRDVQYFLSNSVDSDLLADHERDLVDLYVDALASEGTILDRDETFRLYRAFSYQTLSTAVVAFGLSPLTETDSTVATVLDRAIRSAQRLEFASLLDEL